MLTSELLFVSSPLILLQQWAQFFTGGDILYQHGHFSKPALCCFQCGGSFGAGGGDLGHPAFQIRVAFDFIYPMAIDAVASGKINLKGIVTNIFDFDDIQNAMDKSISDKANIVKAVVKIAEETKV